MAKTYLMPEEIRKIEEKAGNFRDRLLIRLLFHLGCRVSEALVLETGNIDFINKTITIQHLKTSTRITCPDCSSRLSRSSTFCPGCGAKVEQTITRSIEHRKMRTLPVDSETMNLLQEYIARGGPVTKNDKKMIFGINRHRAWQIVRNCSEKADLSKLINPETGIMHNISPHRLRDAFAVHAMKADDSGDGLRLLQVHLGHASFNTTARYRKISGVEHQDWYNKLWNENNPDISDEER